MHVPKRMSAVFTLAVLAGVALSAAPASATTFGSGNVVAVEKLSPSNTATVKTISATCPAGQRVTGGGAFTLSGVHAVITEMRPIHPSSGPDTFEVTAAADQFGILGAWSFKAYAFCATVPANLQLEIVSNPVPKPPTSAGTDQALAQCTTGNGGKYLIGTGGKIDNGGGQVDLGTFPNGSGQIATGSSGFAKEDADGYSGQYVVTGYAVCGHPNAIFGDFVMVRQTFQAPAGASSLSVFVDCPDGMAVSGLGGGTTSPGTHLQEIAPNKTGGLPATRGNFIAVAAVTQASPWQMDTEVYCVS